MRGVRALGTGCTALVLLAVLVVAMTVSAAVGDTIRVSVESNGNQADNESYDLSISADGRYVAFESSASNLVIDDTNDRRDVFVHDTDTGETTRVSVDSNSNQSNGHSFFPSISADGRYVAFHSYATNLVADDTNDAGDVFVHDTETGDTTRVSVDSNGNQGDDFSYDPSISADGRYVAFHSFSTNLVPDDTQGLRDVFVHDTTTGNTTRISVDSNSNPGNEYSYDPSISADGRYVAFSSYASNLVPDDTNNWEDVFVHDTETGDTTRISVDSNSNQGNGHSFYPSISADGRHVAFHSFASNLVPDDTNDAMDVFVHDTTTGNTTRISVDSNSNQSNGPSYDPSISADGRYIAFHSFASNLVPDDTNSWSDVFVHDADTGDTTRVSIDGNGTQGDDDSFYPSISTDGRHVAFRSFASNLVAVDTNGFADVFVHQYLDDPPPPTTTTSTPATTTIPTTTTAPTTTTTLPDEPEPTDHFTDDDGHVFEDDINAIAEAGITFGCNPPENTHFCPTEPFTRGQAAAFVRRALTVPDSNVDAFTDDDNSVFEDDIDAIAGAGITMGCNPPDNTMFCPTEPFTRGQAAAFVRRALNVPATATDYFVDDEGHLFEDDINAIAEAGITMGCNPSANTDFCPDDLLTRGQAAAFIRRALLD